MHARYTALYMDNLQLEKIWTDFAKSIDGKINQTLSTRFKSDNIFNIENDIGSVDMIWADFPAPGRGHITNIKTNFSFKLQKNTSTTLKILPKDFLSRILLVFNQNRQRTEIPEIDKKYIFVSNSNYFIRQIVIDLIQFFDKTPFNSFVITTSKEDDQNSLDIQVNTLIDKQENLDFFYKFGLLLCARLNNAV